MGWKAAVWVLAGLAYLLWPYDVVPDFLVIVGWIDDLLIALLALYMASQAVKKRMEPPPDRPRDEDVIDVEVEDRE